MEQCSAMGTTPIRNAYRIRKKRDTKQDKEQKQTTADNNTLAETYSIQQGILSLPISQHTLMDTIFPSTSLLLVTVPSSPFV